MKINVHNISGHSGLLSTVFLDKKTDGLWVNQWELLEHQSLILCNTIFIW